MSEQPFIDEPPIQEEDTRPRPPAAGSEPMPGWLQQRLDAEAPQPEPVPGWLQQRLNDEGTPRAPEPDHLEQRLAAEEPPRDPMDDTAEILVPRTAARPLLLLVVMAGTLCLCLMLVSFAGFAGYRDGLATNHARITQTLATGIAEQYATGVADLHQGYAELAVARFAWIVETVQAPPQYALDSQVQLAMARTIAAYTPTPSPTGTFTPSPTLTAVPTLPPSPTVEPTATLDPLRDPAYLYDQAALSMRVAQYEDAIEWLDALSALAPGYRAAEAKSMLLEALTTQGRIYLRAQNMDGEDMLSRGVLLIYRANDLAPGEYADLYGEANFVEMYINARDYVNGGYYDQALKVLQQLCQINCDWSYHGLSVRDLQQKAQNKTP